LTLKKGNRLWEKRSTHGRKPKFASPDDLWDAASQYFEWVEENPLTDYSVAHYQGEQVTLTAPKRRPFTILGMCVFLDIDPQTWTNYKRKDDFFGICTKIEGVIRTQKFEGAAAGRFNHAIIARDLGLVDSSKKEVSGPDGGPIEHDHEWTITIVDSNSK
jgi:hypothetical protein